MRNSTLDIRRSAGAVGAEIRGVDLRDPLDDATFGEIRQAFHDHGVVFFRDQHITPEQHVAFAERFGPINVNRFFTPVPGHPRIAEVRKEPDQKKNIGEVWHADHSYDQVPALGSMLLAREVPEYGGDTMFASMAAAYAALSDGLKRTLDGLRAVHSSRHVFGAKAESRGAELSTRLHNPELATQDAVHPVVIRHPETGQRCLYVNRSFTTHIEGWTQEESAPLLDFLYRHGERPEFTCRFRWENGSIALWDNRSTWHFAVNDYHGQRRLMHRITIEGVALG
ncbi:TauD/TfdA family dioxygenase [Roseomonas sp. HF4]|uniref:TauD/TfdA dioxygenase family protein n=1 Tax=Roseomonas sp. HF4 TaxID=2562313 RepID=UPI0010C0433C|nr:TauD/TfdA family dioxygenase [Roseomonas sp. HF4]